jgi:hypothetical protein
MKNSIDFLDQAGDIVRSGRHFSGALELLTFPLLPLVIGG